MPIRDHRIDVRFTEIEKNAIGRIARLNGYKSASAFIRAALAGILHSGIDGLTAPCLASIELLLARLNAKFQQLILFRLSESTDAELAVIVAEVAKVSCDLKTEVYKLKDLPRGRGSTTAP